MEKEGWKTILGKIMSTKDRNARRRGRRRIALFKIKGLIAVYQLLTYLLHGEDSFLRS